MAIFKAQIVPGHKRMANNAGGIVRCAECRLWSPYGDGRVNEKRKILGSCPLMSVDTPEDCYCGMAESVVRTTDG